MATKQGLTVPADFARSYVHRLKEILDRLDFDSIGRVIELMLEARRRDATIFLLGNGGSAATASHFANDLGVCASPENHRPFRSLSLTANNAFITCLANDVGYENVFSLQLRNLMRSGDIVVGISASGNSPNVVKALEYAEQQGAVAVAIVGFDGGKMKRIARHTIHVETELGEYGPSEDVHMVLDHLISGYLALVAQ
jgi:D-sedoheptulose 7-phosphate isomerase